MEVGGEVARCREDTLVLLTLALAVELLPPFCNEVELRLVVHHDLDFLTSAIESVTDGSILGSDVLLEGNILTTSLLHLLSTLYQFHDIETGTGNGQQAHRGEHRETTANVIGNDETLVAFLIGTGAGSTSLGIGNGHDHLLGLLLTALILALLLQQTEGEGSLGGGTTLGDIDHTELLILQIVGKLREIVLTDIVSCEQNRRILLVGHQPGKAIAKGFNHGTGT